MKRSWMILLAVMLLAVFMAVPAMAAEETHTSHTGWSAWNGSEELSSGKFYLTGAVAKSETIAEGDITIGLNGQTYSADGLYLSDNSSGAAVNGGDETYDLATAIGLVSDTTNYVTLMSDHTGAVAVDRDLFLDLNGHTITGDVTVADGKTLYLFDSANASYTYEGGKIAGTVSGTVARAFTTGKLTNYGHNYRYLVVKDAQGNYSAHRIYLTVKSTVLYPMKPALNYRTVLKCDEVVAGYINNGGAYGVRISAVNGDTVYDAAYSNYLAIDEETNSPKNTVVAAATGDNDLITQLNKILDPSWDLEKQKLYTESTLNACAYITLADNFYGDSASVETTSSEVSKSFKEVVQAVDKMDPDSLSAVQKAALGNMYSTYAELMSTWELTNINTEAYTKHEIKYYCLCGDPAGTDTPCANSGHKVLAWQKWDKTTSLPNTTGNYYLTDNVTLSGQLNVAADKFVCIDTRGFDITSSSRIALVYGVLNFTNTELAENGASTLTAKGLKYSGSDGGDSGALLILSTGNVSLYEGITLQVSEDHVVGRAGVVTAYGDLNIYGASVIGTTLIQSEVEIDSETIDYTQQSSNGYGGAIMVGSDGYLYINKGTVTGGEGNARGGAIYSSGTVEIEGSAKITGGTAVCKVSLTEDADGNVTKASCSAHGQGGAVYIAAGTFTLNGENAHIGGGTAGSGGAIYVGSAATLNIVAGTVADGKAQAGHEKADCAYGGNIHNSGTLNMTGGTVTGGQAYKGSGGGLGGNIFAGGNASLRGGIVELGKASSGGNIGINASGSNVTLAGVTVRSGEAGTGGNIHLNVRPCKSVVITGDTLITGGTATGNGGNIAITIGRYAKIDNVPVQNGTITMNGGTISDGTASGSGGNVYVDGGSDALTSESGFTHVYGQFVMNGGTIIGGAAALGSGNNIHFNDYAKGTLAGDVINTVDVDPTATSNSAVNVYVNSASDVVMTGGTIKVAAPEGAEDIIRNTRNVLVRGGSFTMTGGVIRDGFVSSTVGGGNIRLQSSGTFTMELATDAGEGYVAPQILNGTAANTHGGSIFVASGTFTLGGGTVSGGAASKTGGNIYTYDNVTVYAGTVTGGQADCTFKEDGSVESMNPTDPTANIQCVGGFVLLSGGTIDGGVNINSYEEDNSSTIQLNFAPKVLGTGINLTHGPKPIRDENGSITGYESLDDGTAVYCQIPTFDYDDVITMAPTSSDPDENAKIYIKYTAFKYPYQDGLCIVERPAEMDEAQWKNFGETYVDKVFVSASDACAVTFEEDGIWLRPASANGVRYACECGANDGEQHLGECQGYDIRWTAWNVDSKKVLPDMPGYWFITSTTESEYITLSSCATFTRDYYRDADGNWQRAYRCTGDQNGYLYDAPLFFNTSGSGATQLSLTDADLATDIDIHIDLNGYKLEGRDGTRSISGLASYNIETPVVSTDVVEEGVTTVRRTYSRSGQLNLHISDSSQGHVGALAVYGTYSGNTYSNSGVPQGCLIWMPKAGDTLKTYRVELNASNAKQGWGLVLDTAGIVDLYETEIIGGTAAGFTKTADTAYTIGGVAQDPVSVTTVSGSASGGGALCINKDAVVTMHGGTIRDGIAKYDYMSGSNGIGYDRSYGGGNVYINGGTFTVNGGTITGGQAIIGSQGNNTPGSAYGVGGGVYIYDGTFNVSGNARITGNTGADGGASNVFLNGSTVNVTGALGTDAQIGLDMVAFEGAFAASTADYRDRFLRDDTGAATGATAAFAENRLYFTVGSSSDAYLVGYGSASIHPTDQDIAAGLSLNGYGNTKERTTDDLPLESHTTPYSTYNRLMATALAITDAEGDTVILISTDMTSLGEGDVNKIKSLVYQATGVPKDNITVSATHQHSSPSPTTTYYRNDDGEYTDAAYNVLAPNQARVVKTDFAATFYAGILQAATQAFEDRQQSSVSTGILETTSDGDQYNFVRNVVLTASDGAKGMWTDNHKTVKNPGSDEYLKSYESEIDTTMQLVRFTQADNTTIVLANFQTHPHMAGGSDSFYVHSDMVGAFRYYLNGTTGDDVIYFSGASGDVNATTKITADTSLYPYADSTLTQTDKNLLKLEKADIYGSRLAALAATFLSGEGNLTAQTGAMDVEVLVQEYEYDIMVEDATESAIERAKEIVDWDTGSYIIDPTTFESLYWEKNVPAFTNENDRIYSAYHARKIRERLIKNMSGEDTGTFNITAYSLGSIGFVAAPYEMFQMSGQSIKSGSTGEGKYAMTIVASLANGSNGYIPTSEAYINGGYSTDIALYAQGTAEDLVQVYIDMLISLK